MCVYFIEMKKVKSRERKWLIQNRWFVTLKWEQVSPESYFRLFPQPYVAAEDDSELSSYCKLVIVLSDWHLLSHLVLKTAWQSWCIVHIVQMKEWGF